MEITIHYSLLNLCMGNRHTLFIAKFVYGKNHTLFNANFLYGKLPYIKSKVKCITFHITADIRNNFLFWSLCFSILLLYWQKCVQTSTEYFKMPNTLFTTLKMVQCHVFFYVWCFVLLVHFQHWNKKYNSDQREMCCMAKHPISNCSNVVKNFRQMHTNLIDVLHSFNLLWKKCFMFSTTPTLCGCTVWCLLWSTTACIWFESTTLTFSIWFIHHTIIP